MYDLRKLLDQADYEGVENSQAYDNLEYLIEKMGDITEALVFSGRSKRGRFIFR